VSFFKLQNTTSDQKADNAGLPDGFFSDQKSQFGYTYFGGGPWNGKCCYNFRDQCYDFLNIFAEKFSKKIGSKQSKIMQTFDHNIGF
jgi:hypothetical protein